MPEIKNIYQDKKTKKWLFRAYLGTDENGGEVQKTKRGYASQKDAKIAYDKYTGIHDFNKTISNRLCSTNQMTFEESYKDRFVKQYERQVKSQTHESVQSTFEKRMQFFYHFRVRDIISHDTEGWLFKLSQIESRNSREKVNGEALSKSYINQIRGYLKIVLDRAVKEGVIAKNPAEDVSLFPSENKKAEFWEHNEFQKVVNESKGDKIQTHHRRTVYEMLFYTGIRIGELEALSWSNVDSEKSTTTIEKTLIYNTKDDWYFSTPKTKCAYRTIGLGKKFSLKLRQWYDLQKRIGNFEYATQLDGTFALPYSFVNWLKEAVKEAGVRPIKLHVLRHSHVAFPIEQNIRPLSTQERLGHANTQITLGTYGHLYARSDQ